MGDDRLSSAIDDQRRRWAGGERPTVESLLTDHPFLTDPDAALVLIYREAVLREQAGEAPDAEEYTARFPHLADDIRLQFDADPFLTPDAPAGAPAADLPTIPGFELLARLGGGGMGVVYKARHLALDRVVALKLLRGWGGSGAGDLDRLRDEAQAVARVHHPNVVQVFEIATFTDPDGCERPYAVLEYVAGGSLDALLGGLPQPPRSAARFMEVVARAVHHAHGCGLVHCDLKPANVLVAGDDAGSGGCRLDRAVPKVADFGFALRAGRAGAVGGTPAYMAPEQFDGAVERIGPATDVYALGAVLFEMLTGRPPFTATTADALRSAVRGTPAERPSRFVPGVPPDLDAICLKCLEKSPTDRFPTAAALAHELGLFLADRPLTFRPVSAAERVRRWCRRNPAVAGLLVAVAGATAAGLVGTSAAAVVATRRAADAESERGRADGEATAARAAEAGERGARRELARTLYPLLMAEAERAAGRDDWTEMGARLTECPPELRGFEWHVRRANLFDGPRRIDVGGPIAAAVFTPDGREVVACGRIPAFGRGRTPLKGRGLAADLVRPPEQQPTVLAAVYDPATAAEGTTFSGPAGSAGWPTAAAVSPCGRWVAVHATTAAGTGPGEVLLFERASGRFLGKTPAACFAFGPDGNALAVSRETRVEVIPVPALAPGRVVGALAHPVARVWWDGKTVAAAGRPRPAIQPTAAPDPFPADGSNGPNPFEPLNPDRGEVGVWPLDPPGQAGATVPIGPWDVIAPFPPGASLWAVAEKDRLRIVSARPADAKLPAPVTVPGGVTGLAVSPDGRTIAAGTGDGRVRLYDADTLRPRLVLSGPGTPARAMLPAPARLGPSPVTTLEFSPDGARLVSADWSGSAVRVWDAAGVPGGPYPLPGHAAAFHPGGALVAVAGPDGTVRGWDVAKRAVVWTIPAPAAAGGVPPRVLDLAFAADGTTLSAVHADSRLRSWDAATRVEREGRELRFELGGVGPVPGERLTVDGARFSPDGRWLVGWSVRPPMAGLWVEPAAGGKRTVVRRLDGRAAGIAGWVGGVDAWFEGDRVVARVTLVSGAEVGGSAPADGSGAWVDRAAAPPAASTFDHSRVATAEGEGIVIRTAANRALVTLRGARPYRRAVFGPDGRRLIAFAAGGADLYDGAPADERSAGARQ